MLTVHFTCGHCGQLMAVNQDHVGQQVRCPHCQQVVQTSAPTPPSPAPAPGDEAPEILFQVPRPDEPESIFSAAENSGDDLFGSPLQPQVKLPDSLASWPQVSPEAPAASAASPEDQSSSPLPTIGFPTLVETPSEEADRTFCGDPGTTSREEPGLPAPGEFEPTEAALPQLGQPAVTVVRSRRGPWLMALVILPLFSYSLLATLAIVLLWLQLQARTHPLEILPDLEGDGKGATHKDSNTLRYRIPSPDSELPAHLCVALGGTLAIGDLEVTPLRVEKRRIVFRYEGRDRVEPAPGDCLALVLQLRNRSTDVYFRPLDRFFARCWKPNKAGSEVSPFTVLVLGRHMKGTVKFYGGPVSWKGSAGRGERFREPVEKVEGQNFDQVLKPGEEMTTFVCTDPEDHVLGALENYRGPLLWRVQVRRGLVKWHTARGIEREDSATAVIGVEFDSSDVGGKST